MFQLEKMSALGMTCTYPANFLLICLIDNEMNKLEKHSRTKKRS